MRLSDFHYTLPPELIARYPLEKRSASRLLHVGDQGELTHSHFSDLLHFITENDLLVFNQSKVIPARLIGAKETGGRVEILVERILDDQHVLVHLKSSKAPAIGSCLHFEQGYSLTVIERRQNLYVLAVSAAVSMLEMVERIGEIPLPPYLHRKAEEADKERYQTIYAMVKGSVAAPTAGLHFDEAMMARLRAQGTRMAFLTLHVGAGTFLPVRTENIADHVMHPEYIQVTADICEQVQRTRERGGRVIAVGTTTARSLETAARTGVMQPYAGDTDLFITPGYTYRCVDALITNFHVPESSLLMLVSALGGYAAIMHAYQEAVARQYRFYSYGDAMMVIKAQHSGNI